MVKRNLQNFNRSTAVVDFVTFSDRTAETIAEAGEPMRKWATGGLHLPRTEDRANTPRFLRVTFVGPSTRTSGSKKKQPNTAAMTSPQAL